MLPVGKCGRNKHLRVSQDPEDKTIGRRYRRYLRIGRREERRTRFRFHQRFGQPPNPSRSTPRAAPRRACELGQLQAAARRASVSWI
jgi:hypothetical protein